MTRIVRRRFLSRAALGLGTALLGGPMLRPLLSHRLAHAAETQDRYLVFCYFEGGWDHLLGLDPRDPSLFTADTLGETGIEPAYDLLPPELPRSPVQAGPFTFGPAIGELAGLTEHYSVVRGIHMATLTHEVGRRYFITGRPPVGQVARGSSVASLATEQLGGERPVPHLAHLVESYAEDLPAYAAAMPVAAVQHLPFVLQESLGIPTLVPQAVRQALEAHHAADDGHWHPADPAASALAETYRRNRARAAELVEQGYFQHFDFTSDAQAAARLHYGFAPGQVESPYGRAAMAAQALKVGLSRVVSVALSTRLDTHDGTWATNHGPRLQAGFDALARLITDLRGSEAPGGGSYLDRTTIVAFSEFGRTARLNPRNGRDHLLTNCALLAGAGIQPGVLFGASSDKGMEPERVDLATGQAAPDGVSLRPEHVMTTALHAAGLDATSLRGEPLSMLLA